MNLKINGKFQYFDVRQLSVRDVIEKNNIDSPEMVSVQVNGEFIERDQFSLPLLKNNDEIDFLYFMGGGN